MLYYELMIVTKEDTIPSKKIAKMLGSVEAKSGAFAFNIIRNAKKNLEKEAEKLGANAIINYKYNLKRKYVGFENHATGDAVIIE
jgi:uncharacterized protein YbjQ (UPF0145 family)